jgi:Zn-dependent peptidase ImmA (M78 family)
MPGTSQNLVLAFQKTGKVINACWDKAMRSPEVLSVDDLRDIVAEMYGVEITMISVAYEADHVKSMIERWDGGKKALVAVQAGQSSVAERFAAVKELCHVIIDAPEDFSAPDCSLIEKLLQGASPDLLALENKGLWSERAAEVMARELLYPHEFRRGDLALLNDNKTTLAALALKYKVPEIVASRVLKEAYIDACDGFWQATKETAQAAE